MPTSNASARNTAAAWYRQPVVWLGILVFVASLGGCIWMIVLGTQQGDTPLETSHTVFGVPVSAHSAARPSSDPPQ